MPSLKAPTSYAFKGMAWILLIPSIPVILAGLMVWTMWWKQDIAIFENYDENIRDHHFRNILSNYYEAAGLTPDKLRENLGKYLPVEVLDNVGLCGFFVPELDAETVTLLSTNNMSGKVGLHGAHHETWESIHARGLQAKATNSHDEPRILNHETAGIYENRLGYKQYSVLSYGSDFGKSKTCRIVISFVTDFDECKRFKDTPKESTIDGWMLSECKNVIPLWMIEIDTKVFTELVLKKYPADKVIHNPDPLKPKDAMPDENIQIHEVIREVKDTYGCKHIDNEPLPALVSMKNLWKQARPWP